MTYVALICAIFLTVTCHAGTAATRFNLAQAQAPKECVTNGDSANCVSAWNKDPVFGVIGIQSGL
jgi:hypothetical protein